MQMRAAPLHYLWRLLCVRGGEVVPCFARTGSDYEEKTPTAAEMMTLVLNAADKTGAMLLPAFASLKERLMVFSLVLLTQRLRDAPASL